LHPNKNNMAKSNSKKTEIKVTTKAVADVKQTDHQGMVYRPDSSGVWSWQIDKDNK